MRLTDFAPKGPFLRWFHFHDAGRGSLAVIPGEHEAEAPQGTVVSLQLEHISTNEQTRMAKADAVRMVRDTRGSKKYDTGPDWTLNQALAHRAIRGWKIGRPGLVALRAEVELDKVPAETSVDFNQENLKFLIERSNIAVFAVTALDTHSEWFGGSESEELDPEAEAQAEEDALGNSEGGQSGNTAESPAATV